MTRAEKVREAQRLRAAKVPVREIAERMGAKYRTVWNWLDDPDGEKLKARKRGYAGACVDCGGPTDGTAGPGKASQRCQGCRTLFERTDLAHRLGQGSHDLQYTDDHCLDAVRRAVEVNGGAVSKKRYNELRGSADPSGVLLMHRFDTWWEVCDRAGVGHVNNRRRTYARLTREECIAAFDRVAAVFGRPPSVNEYNDYRRAHPELKLPSEPTIRLRVGGWSPLIEVWRSRSSETLKAAA